VVEIDGTDDVAPAEPAWFRSVPAHIGIAGAQGTGFAPPWHARRIGGVPAGSPPPRAPTIAGCPRLLFKEKAMTVARITEISSVSPKSFEDAIVQGVERANKTLKNVKGAWVKDQEVTIDGGKISGYKVILKVTFVLTD
jgi:flavin-binding protein dodecin